MCIRDRVQAGALQEVQLNADDIKSRNTAASVDAATLNGKLYAYPLTADNGYFCLLYTSTRIYCLAPTPTVTAAAPLCRTARAATG